MDSNDFMDSSSRLAMVVMRSQALSFSSFSL